MKQQSVLSGPNKTELKCIGTELQTRPQSICGALSGLDATAVQEYASRIGPARGGAHACFECVAHYGHPQRICGAERGTFRGSICGAVPEVQKGNAIGNGRFK